MASFAADSRVTRMADAERVALFDRLDAADADNPAKNRRSMARIPFRKTGVAVRVYHPGGSMITTAVDMRNLSAGGTSFLYHGFLHKNTKIEIVLRRHLGGEDVVRGLVTHCQHVSRTFHLIGTRFDNKVFPKLYLDPADWSDLGDGAPVDPATLGGRVLHVDESEMDRLLLRHNLAASKIDLVGVATLAEAVAALAGKPADVVLCDMACGADSVARVVAAAREAGFNGPVGVLTAESGPAAQRAAAAAGAGAVLGKPYDAQKLLSLLATWLAAGAGQAEALFSTLPDVPATKPLVEQYVQRARVLVRDLRRFVSADDLKSVRAVCQTLRGTGAGFGFASLSQIAKDAVTTLDETASVREAQVHLQRLELTCRRLAVK